MAANSGCPEHIYEERERGRDLKLRPRMSLAPEGRERGRDMKKRLRKS